MTVPQIFDRRLVQLRLQRAAARGAAADGAGFLLDRALEDLGDRLLPVLRGFEVGAALGDVTGGVARVLMQSGRVGQVIRVSALPGEGVDIVADDERLPLPPESIGLAVSLLTLQSVNDLPGVLAQVRRALRPDGLFLLSLIGGDSLTELRQCLLMAEDEIRGGATPRVAPMVDVRTLGQLIQRAGLALPVTDSDRFTVRYRSLGGLIGDLRAWGATNALAARGRPLTRGIIARAAELYGELFSDPDGKLRVTFEILSASGWAPHDSQQKPLKPGSAQQSLASALAEIAKVSDRDS